MLELVVNHRLKGRATCPTWNDPILSYRSAGKYYLWRETSNNKMFKGREHTRGMSALIQLCLLLLQKYKHLSFARTVVREKYHLLEE